jgi:hypothetical protein
VRETMSETGTNSGMRATVVPLTWNYVRAGDENRTRTISLGS